MANAFEAFKLQQLQQQQAAAAARAVAQAKGFSMGPTGPTNGVAHPPVFTRAGPTDMPNADRMGRIGGQSDGTGMTPGPQFDRAGPTGVEKLPPAARTPLPGNMLTGDPRYARALDPRRDGVSPPYAPDPVALPQPMNGPAAMSRGVRDTFNSGGLNAVGGQALDVLNEKATPLVNDAWDYGSKVVEEGLDWRESGITAVMGGEEGLAELEAEREARAAAEKAVTGKDTIVDAAASRDNLGVGNGQSNTDRPTSAPASAPTSGDDADEPSAPSAVTTDAGADPVSPVETAARASRGTGGAAGQAAAQRTVAAAESGDWETAAQGFLTAMRADPSKGSGAASSSSTSPRSPERAQMMAEIGALLSAKGPRSQRWGQVLAAGSQAYDQQVTRVQASEEIAQQKIEKEYQRNVAVAKTEMDMVVAQESRDTRRRNLAMAHTAAIRAAGEKTANEALDFARREDFSATLTDPTERALAMNAASMADAAKAVTNWRKANKDDLGLGATDPGVDLTNKAATLNADG